MGFNLFDLLLPREGKFFKYLNHQAALLNEECVAFKNLIAQLEDLSEEEVRKRSLVIKDLENQGDQVETTIIDELNKTFITPIDREDIHALTVQIDKAMDGIDSISRKISIYHIRKAPSKAFKFADLLVAGSEELQNLLRLFENKLVPYASIEKIHQIENQGDELFHEAMADLFAKEDNPIKIIKLKELYEHLEQVIDTIDGAAKMIRGIVVKQG